MQRSGGRGDSGGGGRSGRGSRSASRGEQATGRGRGGGRGAGRGRDGDTGRGGRGRGDGRGGGRGRGRDSDASSESSSRGGRGRGRGDGGRGGRGGRGRDGGRDGGRGGRGGGGRNLHMAQLRDFGDMARLNQRDVLAFVNPPDVETRSALVQHAEKPAREAWRHDPGPAGAAIPWQRQRGRVISNFFMVRDLERIPSEVAVFEVNVYEGNITAAGEQKREERKGEEDSDIVDRMDKEPLAVAVARAVRVLGLGRYAYDGKRILYVPIVRDTPALIQQPVLTQQVDTIGNRPVTVRLTRQRALGVTTAALFEEQPAIRQWLDIVLRQHIMEGFKPGEDKKRWWVAGQRALFPVPSGSDIIPFQKNPALLAVYGFSVAWKITRAGLALNRDFTVGVFLKGGAALAVMAAMMGKASEQEFVQEYVRNFRDRRYQRRLANIDLALKNAKIKTTHTGFAKKFKELGGPASEEKFEHEGRRTTVAEYFQARYQALRFPDAPTVNIGSTKKRILIPAELVKISEGQSRNNQAARLELTSEVIRHSAKRPGERMHHIRHGDSDVINSFSARDGILAASGLNSLASEPMPVGAVLLHPAQLQYQNGQAHPEHKGEWNPTNSKNQSLKFVVAKEINYHLLVIKGSYPAPRNYGEFMSKLEQKCSAHGMRLTCRGPRNRAIEVQARPEEIRQFIQEFTHNTSYRNDLLIVILSSRQDHAMIKALADPNGVLTQCIQAKTIDRTDDSTFVNICTKINSKVGGINHTLAGRLGQTAQAGASGFQNPPHSLGWMFQEPCMVLGIDVSHPEPGSNHPSTAAVVASMDSCCVQYAAHLSSQASRQEMVAGLAEAIEKLLAQFRERNGVYPKHIILYRDGVSESQYDKVLEDELPAIQEGLEHCGLTLGTNAHAVKLAVIVCQKRHKTRLVFEEGKDSFVNLCPGIAVDGSAPDSDADHDITSARYIEFYLNSHVSIQGTGKPCRYTLIYDSMGLKVPELQLFTFWLCHLYSRCNRSVSYPTPAYYAHWASKRAGELQSQGVRLHTLQRFWSDPTGPSMYFI